MIPHQRGAFTVHTPFLFDINLDPGWAFYNSFLKRNAVSFTGCQDSLSSLVSHLEFGQGKWKGPQKNTHTSDFIVSRLHASPLKKKVDLLDTRNTSRGIFCPSHCKKVSKSGLLTSYYSQSLLHSFS